MLRWAAATVAMFACLETWLGNGLGEMENFLLAAIVFALLSRDSE